MRCGGGQTQGHGSQSWWLFTRAPEVWVGERTLVWKVSLSPGKSFCSECQVAPSSKAQSGGENKAWRNGAERILRLRNKDDRRKERNKADFRRNSAWWVQSFGNVIKITGTTTPYDNLRVRRKPASSCHRWGNLSSVKLSDLPFDLANNGLLTWTNWDWGSWLTPLSSINILPYSLPVTQSLGTQNHHLMKSLGRRRV